MITKQNFIQNVLHEIEIIKHLSEKITPEILAYKPTEKQRTTKELLGYLAYGPLTALKFVNSGDMAIFGTTAEAQKNVTVENFKALIDAEGAEIKSILEGMTDETMNEEVDLWGSGELQPRSEYVLHLTLEAFVCYKMQLFLYLKSSGLEHLNTSNLWQGKDPAPKA